MCEDTLNYAAFEYYLGFAGDAQWYMTTQKKTWQVVEVRIV